MREWINIIDGLLGDDRNPDDEQASLVYDFLSSLVPEAKYEGRAALLGAGASHDTGQAFSVRRVEGFESPPGHQIEEGDEKPMPRARAIFVADDRGGRSMNSTESGSAYPAVSASELIPGNWIITKDGWEYEVLEVMPVTARKIILRLSSAPNARGDRLTFYDNYQSRTLFGLLTAPEYRSANPQLDELGF